MPDQSGRFEGMDISLTLAKIIGVYGLIISISAILNFERVNLLVRELLESEYLLYITGVMALIIGLTIITIHNDHTADYNLLITLVGWLAFIEGVIVLLVPDLADKIIREITRHRAFLLLAVIAVMFASGWLAIEGFLLGADVKAFWGNLIQS
jgi:uncharacterized protein YjeT (DUF2065 family)